MKKILSASFLFMAAAAMPSSGQTEIPAGHQVRVIAHRGYWKTEGSAQNSLASLRKAAEIGCYGSEFDIHLTSDGVAVINHDNDFEGVVIQDNPWSELENQTLANGEKIPTLRRYLTEGAKYPGLKLILELKQAATPQHETRAVETVMDMVEELGLRDQAEYISFSYHICKEIIARDPQAKVAYLGGNVPVARLSDDGIPGLDYNIGVARNNPDLFDEARQAGIYTNIWTVNKEDDMRFIISRGVDFITTDEPELAKTVIKQYAQQ